VELKRYFYSKEMRAITLLLAALVVSLSTAFSAIPDISIVGQEGGLPQKLPGGYVNTFTRWFVERIGDDQPENISRDAGTGLALERLPTEGDDTFVNPTSATELWWPLDLEALQVRPCLEVLMQGGSPRYALAGLTVRVPAHSSGDCEEWRNYGLNSQPLARQWTKFEFAVEGGFRIECFVGKNADDGEEDESDGVNGGEKDGDVSETMKEEDETYLWDRIFPGELGALDDRPSAHAMFASQRMDEALESVAVFLSNVDESSPLANGFHLVSFPLTEQWTDLPRVQNEKGYKLLCLATAEPDAEALVEMDEGLVALTATSVLNVDVLPTASGSESQYLPQSYRTLYCKK